MSLSLPAILVIVLLAGAILFVVGTIVVRANKIDRSAVEVVEPDVAPHWLASIGADETPLDAQGRIEIVERLAFLREPWCIEALRAAASEERDQRVGKAIKGALKSLR